MNYKDSLPLHNEVVQDNQAEMQDLSTQDKNCTNSGLVQGSRTSDPQETIIVKKEYTKKEAFKRLLDLTREGVTATDVEDKESEYHILMNFLGLERYFN